MMLHLSIQSLLLAFLCIVSVRDESLVDALSLISAENSNGSDFRVTRGGFLGIRPELSLDSYAHRSAIGCSFGKIDVKIASEEKGLGAFATSDIPFGTLVGRYNGESLTLKEVKARFWNKGTKTQEDLDWESSRKERGQGITGHFLFELPNGSFVDAEDADKSSWVRFMNHADPETSDCNIKAFIKTSESDDDEEFPLMYTISDIRAGEELCWNYGGEFFR